MKPDEIERLYDGAYAASYDEKFLESAFDAPNTRHEVELLASLLTPGSRWLDVACGSGYFLRRFPHVDRVGLDLSPAMLERARAGNPGIELRRHDYRVPIAEWADRFDLVSCMWYAYCYVDSLAELLQVVGNLAAWTAPAGRCFVPLADPDLLTRCELPYRLPYQPGRVGAGELTITGVLWTFSEGNGAKVHSNLLAPSVELMREQFARYFERVEIVRYPPHAPGVGARPALLASGKRG